MTESKTALILGGVANEIVFEVLEGIGILTVNRPEARNALNWAAQEQFAMVVTRCTRDPSIRALIITSVGEKAFVAGGDLKELLSYQGQDAARRLQRTMGKALWELSQSTIPVIAAVNGDAIGGGCEILTACDIRIAAAHACFRFPQVSLGLTTGWGGTGRLVRLIGQSRASDWLLTGRIIDAQEAETAGFIHRVIPPGSDVRRHAYNLAEAMTHFPEHALAAAKTLIRDAVELSLADVNENEKSYFTELWQTNERLEAVKAIVEKRAPKSDVIGE